MAPSAAACMLERAAPPGGPSGDRPHYWTGKVTLTLGDLPPLQRLGPWSRLASRFSASSSRCTPAACPSGHPGLAGGPPVRIGQRPGEERVGLLLLCRGHPPRVSHVPSAAPSNVACCCSVTVPSALLHLGRFLVPFLGAPVCCRLTQLGVRSAFPLLASPGWVHPPSHSIPELGVQSEVSRPTANRPSLLDATLGHHAWPPAPRWSATPAGRRSQAAGWKRTGPGRPGRRPARARAPPAARAAC